MLFCGLRNTESVLDSILWRSPLGPSDRICWTLIVSGSRTLVLKLHNRMEQESLDSKLPIKEADLFAWKAPFEFCVLSPVSKRLDGCLQTYMKSTNHLI